MQTHQLLNERKKKLWFYFGLSCFVWGFIVFPIMGQVVWDIPISWFSIFLSILFAILFTTLPMKSQNTPPEGKEYYLMYYPLVIAPIGGILYYLKYQIFW
jgi:hypothetical protein